MLSKRRHLSKRIANKTTEVFKALHLKRVYKTLKLQSEQRLKSREESNFTKK